MFLNTWPWVTNLSAFCVPSFFSSPLILRIHLQCFFIPDGDLEFQCTVRMTQPWPPARLCTCPDVHVSRRKNIFTYSTTYCLWATQICWWGGGGGGWGPGERRDCKTPPNPHWPLPYNVLTGYEVLLTTHTPSSDTHTHTHIQDSHCLL